MTTENVIDTIVEQSKTYWTFIKNTDRSTQINIGLLMFNMIISTNFHGFAGWVCALIWIHAHIILKNSIKKENSNETTD